MTKAIKETRGRKPYKNGGHGGGWQRLSSQLATVFDKAIEKHGGQDALAQTVANELSERPVESLRLLSTLMPKNINVNAELTASDSLASALSNVQIALSQDKADKAKQADIIEGDIIESE